jgi:hypothetical protein
VRRDPRCARLVLVAPRRGRGDEPETTGDVTDDDQWRVKRTYSGEFYEEGSLKDVRRDDQV